MFSTLCRVVPVLLWTVAAVNAQPVDLSGDWHLNVEKSRWGDVRKPVSVVVRIQHREPSLSYSGEVMYANEDVRDFGFDGAIDGKDYPVERSFGPGKIVMKRVDLTTVESVMKSDDGQYVESARTSVSQDGKTMTRRLRLQSPEGVKTWVEVYEKR